MPEKRVASKRHITDKDASCGRNAGRTTALGLWIMPNKRWLDFAIRGGFCHGHQCGLGSPYDGLQHHGAYKRRRERTVIHSTAAAPRRAAGNTEKQLGRAIVSKGGSVTKTYLAALSAVVMGTGLVVGCGVLAAQPTSPSSSPVSHTTAPTTSTPSSTSTVSSVSDSSHAPTEPSTQAPSKKSAPAKTRWTFDGPLPETGGIGFDITWNQFVFPRTFQPTDFSRVHFWDHGYRFTFLMPSTHVDVTGPLGLGMPKLVFNRPYAVHTNWVSRIILHPIGNNLLVTCILLRPASHYSFGTSPMQFSFYFSR